MGTTEEWIKGAKKSEVASPLFHFSRLIVGFNREFFEGRV